MRRDYDKVGSLLASQSIFQSASEIHGMICGQICSGAQPFDPDTAGQILGIVELPEVIRELMTRFAREMEQELSDGSFSFQPLLPGDDEEMSARTQALGSWCDGFTVGFAAGFSKGDEHLQEETREVLTDFARIAEIESAHADELGAEDEQEEDYMEVVEFVRVAASTVFMQNATISPEPADGENQNFIH